MTSTSPGALIRRNSMSWSMFSGVPCQTRSSSIVCSIQSVSAAS
jgi:hypothetical protein